MLVRLLGSPCPLSSTTSFSLFETCCGQARSLHGRRPFKAMSCSIALATSLVCLRELYGDARVKISKIKMDSEYKMALGLESDVDWLWSILWTMYSGARYLCKRHV